jgi:hypothetical protein
MPNLTNFASRQPASCIVGDVFTEEVKDSATMLAKANLAGWDVRLRPLDSDARRTKETFEVLRTNPHDGGLDRLGVSGERYGTVQNETAFAMFDGLDPVWEAAGSFKNGAVVYGQATTDYTIVLDPQGAADEIKPHIVVSTTHDGSGALRIGRTAMRLDCYNQFNLMFGKGLQHSISVRHTLNVADRIKAIMLAWKTNNLYYDALSVEANALFAQAASDKQFFGIVEKFMGDRPELNTKGAQTKWDNSMELYAEAWRGQPNEKARGTAWGVFNALIERNQWGRTIQKTNGGVENFAMAGMGFDVPTNTFRQNAFEAARSLVTV